MAWGFDVVARVANTLRGGPTLRTRGADEGGRARAGVTSKPSSVAQFYQAYFGAPGEKCVIQVGANDGIMCDPLRRFLRSPEASGLQAVLIEPVPFYYERLKALYAGDPKITALNVACGAARGRKELYFIDPGVADQMNGTGPANDWAHGQGSFDREVVTYWIDRNRFRGDDYVQKMQAYKEAIQSIEVDVVPLSEIGLSRQSENLLVVIDVQGFEFDVIRGIDWADPPAHIVFEDDLDRSGPIDAYLRSRGYEHICGRTDKVYSRSGAAER